MHQSTCNVEASYITAILVIDTHLLGFDSTQAFLLCKVSPVLYGSQLSNPRPKYKF